VVFDVLAARMPFPNQPRSTLSLQTHRRSVVMLDNMKWVDAVMAFLAASNFVVSSIRTFLLLTGS
jgi:hypothetical protein